MREFDALLELRYVSERNLRESLRSLNGYLKFTSMVWIRAFRQPILDGLLMKRWSPDARRVIKDFCDRHRRDELLLRVDTLDSRWSERRGGYIISRSNARAVILDLSNEGKVAALLEPVSPYRDSYSLAAVTDDAQEKMTVEVVGPGFDASDLLRGDSFPHERFEASIPKLSRPLHRLRFEPHTYVIRPEDYRRTVDERLLKIGARLRNPAFPKAVIDSADVQRTRLAKEAIDYLRRTKQSELLNRLEVYEPIPKHFVERFVTGVGRIVDGLRRYNIRLGPISVSGTFTARGRFVFWDFFPVDLAKAGALYLR